MRFVRYLVLVVLVGALVAISAVSALGADNGSVGATVSVQDAPCITITSSGIDYGSKTFSTQATPVIAVGSITSIASCSTASQTIYVKGAPATGTAATWQLVPALACPTINQYVHEIDNPENPTSYLPLNSTGINFGGFNSTIKTISNIPTRLTMPCTGSAGGGQIMSTQILFSVTAP
jgi:hypothetical protein